MLAEARKYAELAVSLASNENNRELLEEVQKAESTGIKCFVATATMECDSHSDVVTLREWRDQVLRRSKLGRVSIKAYYVVGPWLAKPLEHSAPLRWLSRHLLISRIASVIRKTAH